MTTTFFKDTLAGGRRTWPWAVPFLLVLFFFAGQIVAIVPAIESGWIAEDEIETYPNILYMLFVVFGTVMLPLMLWLRLFERRSWQSVGMLSANGQKGKFGRGFGLGLLMATLSVVGIWLLGGYGLETQDSIGAARFGPILLLAAGFVIQSSVEEIFFRGWMLSRMTERYGFMVGIFSNAVLFTLMHAGVGGGEQFILTEFALFFVMTMAFSIFLSLLVVRQGSVWGACAWHAAWNWSFITWFGLPTTGIALNIKPLFVDLQIAEGASDWLTGGAIGPENSAVTALFLVLGCLLLARGLKLRKA